jgi:hypothetical protein
LKYFKQMATTKNTNQNWFATFKHLSNTLKKQLFEMY